MNRISRLLALLAVIGVIAAAVSGCGSSGGDSSTATRGAAGEADPAWGIAAVSQAGRYGAVNILRCTAGGDPSCSTLDGAMGPIRQMVMDDDGPLFAGTFNGDVLTCDPYRPTSCDAIGKVPGITSIAASALGTDDGTPSVYLGTTVGYEGAKGDLWRCPQATANAKCRNVGRPRPGDFVASLAIMDRSVFAGLGDGRILKCTTGAPTSTCTTFATPGGAIQALDVFRDRLGVATDTGVVWTCTQGESGTGECTKVTSMPDARATAVALYGDTVFAGFALDNPDARGLSGAVVMCEQDAPCTPVALPAPVADPKEGDPSTAPVLALVAASDDNLWVGQGTADSFRGQGAISMCPYQGSCTTKWSDPDAGITAMTEVPSQ